MKISEVYTIDNELLRRLKAITNKCEWVNALPMSVLESIDITFLKDYGARVLDDFLEGQYNVSQTTFFNTLGIILNNYSYELKGLYNLTLLDGHYDTLDNVNEIRTETRKTVNDYGARTDTMVHGEQKDTIDNDTRKTTTTIADRDNSVNIGAQTTTVSNTDNLGAQHNEVVNGAKTDTITSTGSTSPFDSSDYSKATDRNANTNVYGSSTNTTDVDAVTNTNSGSQSIGARSDTQTIGGGTDITENDATTDTIKRDSYTDTNTKASAQDETNDTYNVTRHGNIGVTTSGQLIRDDRETHEYVFYNRVAEILAFELCKSFIWG